MGRVLLGAEVLGMVRQPEETRTPSTQGLEVHLGVYDHASKEVLDDHIQLISGEFSWTLGGWRGACVVTTTVLGRDDQRWVSAAFDIPVADKPRHLHRLMLDERADPSGKAFAATRADGRRLRDNELLLIARCLRWRLSVDHARPQSSPNLLYWSTPTTDEWIRRWVRNHDSGKDWGGMLAGLGPRLAGCTCQSDHAPNNPNDWGDVLLEDDPLTVLTLGPSSDRASTHADVANTLKRADPQLTVAPRRLEERESHQPIAGYAKALFDLAKKEDILKCCDVVLAYRGGGLEDMTEPRAVDDRKIVTAQDKQELLAAATELAGRGVEVVVGIGHGDQSVFPDSAQLPIGVFEALTPTGAAEWVLAEHVNTRLAGSGFGQPTRPRAARRR